MRKWRVVEVNIQDAQRSLTSLSKHHSTWASDPAISFQSCLLSASSLPLPSSAQLFASGPSASNDHWTQVQQYDHLAPTQDSSKRPPSSRILHWADGDLFWGGGVLHYSSPSPSAQCCFLASLLHLLTPELSLINVPHSDFHLRV